MSNVLLSLLIQVWRLYQTPDVVMNMILKWLVRQQYNDYVRCILQDNVLSDGLKPGDKVPIQRETLIDFVEKAYDKINRLQACLI